MRIFRSLLLSLSFLSLTISAQADVRNICLANGSFLEQVGAAFKSIFGKEQGIFPEIESHFSTPTDQGHQAEIDFFDQADGPITFSIYNLTDLRVAQALVRAKERGLDVRVIEDRENLQRNLKNKVPAALYLQKHGIQVVGSSKGFNISHLKVATMGDKKALIMTMNATQKYRVTRDFGVITTDPVVVMDLKNIFQTDLENAKTGKIDSPDLKSPWVVCSPVNAEPKLIELIESAGPKGEIITTTENLGNPGIQAALIKAAGKGIRVRLIAPLKDQNPNPAFNIPFLKELRAGGVDARGMPGVGSKAKPYMHQKMLVVTTESGDKMAYIGSVNFSVNSASVYAKAKSNHREPAREFGIIFSDKKAIAELEGNFEKDFKLSETLEPEQLSAWDKFWKFFGK